MAVDNLARRMSFDCCLTKPGLSFQALQLCHHQDSICVLQVEASQNMIRIVGLSATLPNYKDVASFLGVSEPGLF